MEHENRTLNLNNQIEPFPYQRYDQPLRMEDDAVVIPDLELPFYNVDFIEQLLDLADAWRIKQCIMAGDVVHLDKLSGWEPNWTTSNNAGLSTELDISRQELKRIEVQFDRIDYILGNHEGRYLRTMKTELSPKEILILLDIYNSKWRIAPYYFSYLDTVNGRFQIEHPKNAGKFSASKLASKYLCHVLMAHSHQFNYTFDPSGNFFAIEMGCTVDEAYLAYCAQRHNTSPMHIVNAIIVRDGYPYPINEWTDWKVLARM